MALSLIAGQASAYILKHVCQNWYGCLFSFRWNLVCCGTFQIPSCGGVDKTPPCQHFCTLTPQPATHFRPPRPLMPCCDDQCHHTIGIVTFNYSPSKRIWKACAWIRLGWWGHVCNSCVCADVPRDSTYLPSPGYPQPLNNYTFSIDSNRSAPPLTHGLSSGTTSMCPSNRMMSFPCTY